MIDIGSIKGNYLKCYNRVVVEGVEVGGFESFTTMDNRQSLSSTAEITMPFYTIINDKDKPAIGTYTKSYPRIDQAKYKLILGAHIQVFLGYTVGYNDTKLQELKVFDGFIKQVASGFPTKILCEDMGFMLRFGSVGKGWNKAISIKEAFSGLVEVANKGFKAFRSEQGLIDSYPTIKMKDGTVETKFVYQLATDLSPYFVIESVLSMYKLYSRVDNDGLLWVGTGSPQTADNTAELDTRYNVLERNLSIDNGFFNNYTVEVNFIKNGRKIETYKLGSTNGQVKTLQFNPGVKTAEQAKEVAQRAMEGLRGESAKGTITLLAYPQVDIFDWVDYNDTLFKELSGSYYVIEKRWQCGDGGYRQVLTVVNKTVMDF